MFTPQRDITSILKRIKKSVQATAPKAVVILYGSTARKTDKDHSDIDLLILIDTDKVSDQNLNQITYPLYDIEFDTGTIISPTVIAKKDWESRYRITPFYENVIKEGVIL
jgi:predicted nucleotidyltransferase